MESTPPSAAEDPDTKPLSTVFHKAATFCLVSPLLAIAANVFNATAGTFILVAGIAAGVFALCGIPRHGSKGILVKAVAGLLIQVLLFVSAIYTANKVREFARQIQEETVAKGK